MCAAVLGQCGPRVPRFKSLFHSQRYSDEISFLRGDRQAELQSIWQEIGEDKYQKLEELRQMVAAAMDKIYERALEECMRRKMALEDMVIKSENRLREFLGSSAPQVLAPKELPLQVRLSMNMARLQNLDNARLGGYGWVGGLVVLVELRHRVAALREMLRLPPFDSLADLDEVLASTTEALHNLCPGEVASIPSCHPPKGEQKPIFQRLQRFYQTLCAMENVWVNSFASKDMEKDLECFHCPETSTRMCLQELELKGAKNRNLDLDGLIEERGSLPLATHIVSFGFTKKRSSSKFGHKGKESRRHNKQYSEETSKLEQLSHKILKKLEDINRHVKCAAKPVDMVFSPLSSYSQNLDIECSPSSGITENSHISKGFSTTLQSASMSPSSEDTGGGTPTSVLPETIAKAPTSSYHLSIGITPSHWTGTAVVYEKKEAPLMLLHQPEDQLESLDACWAEQYENDLVKCEVKEEDNMARQVDSASGNANKPVNSISRAAKTNTITNEPRDSGGLPSERWSLVSVTCNQKNPSLAANKPASLPQARVPPPPPPPPPSSLGAKKLLTSKSTKLKRSVTISRLYMGMKRKVDGAAHAQSTPADVAIQRRMVGVPGTRDGMAEALAEITRRSSYFRKIEDDVQKHATSIMEVKSGLESFETRDMQKLLRFHESIEARLEHLTDESQVLARFDGFPIKKLETVRAAASLYMRMSSLVQQIENWPVDPPMSEQVDKITNFFDKVKTDVEVIERTKDEDISRFHGQKIIFSFEIITCIKEAAVGLSSRTLALALKDSQRTKASITIGDEYLYSKDMNKLRASFQMLWKVFQLAFRTHNFAGGHDDKAEQLCCNLAKEMETYPSSFWLELVNK